MRRVIFAAVVVLFLPSWVSAQTAGEHCALQLVQPLASGAAGTGKDADDRIYHAYPGIAYEIQATARCGSWEEYWFELNNEPAGMTIDDCTGPVSWSGRATCGVIQWTPGSTASNVEVCVHDDDEQDCETYTITVATTRFKFVDADDGNDTTGDGSISTPWQTFEKGVLSAGADSILYLRGATAAYTFTGLSSILSTGRYMVNVASHPVIWLAYPDESPVLDYAYDHSTWNETYVRLTGSTIYVDGLTIRDGAGIVLQFARESGFGSVARRLTFDGLGPGEDGTNSGAIMYVSNTDTPSYYDIIQRVTVQDMYYGTGNCAFKMYTMRSPVVDYNTITNIHDRVSASEAAFAIKADIQDYTLRGNTCTSVTAWPTVVPCIGGNMNSPTLETRGEIYHNLALIASGSQAFELNNDGVSGPVYIERNTFLGTMEMKNVTVDDGPFTYGYNVVVNAGGSGGSCPERLTCISITDYTPIVVANSLQGATGDAIIDGSGNLTGTYRTDYLGSRGYELGSTTAPIRLRITGAPE